MVWCVECVECGAKYLSDSELLLVVEQTQSGNSGGRGGNLSVTSDSDNEESQNNRKKSLNFKQRKSKWVGKAPLCRMSQSPLIKCSPWVELTGY